MDHHAAIATLTDAGTTAELAAALVGFTDLRTDAAPGTAPGVRLDAPDGAYFNGYHLFTKSGPRVAATALGDLPQHTLDLLEQLDQEKRDQAEHADLTSEQNQGRGRGRPAVGRAVPVRFPNWLIRELDQDVEALGVSRADLIRALTVAARKAISDEASSTGADRRELLRTLIADRALPGAHR